MEKIPETHQDMIEDDVKAIAYLATIMPNGTPQLTPVWFNVEGEYFVINSAVGRTKDRNIRARPDVALTITDPESAYRYIQIRGVVVEIIEENALEHIHKLAGKYMGTATFQDLNPADKRVKFKIKPINVNAFG